MGEQTEATPAKKPRVAVWIATGFGLGYLPIAPGTWGSLGGLIAALAVGSAFPNYVMNIGAWWPNWARGGLDPRAITFRGLLSLNLALAVVTLLISRLGVWAARHAARHFGKSDPGQVVVDEISGQMITLLPVGTPHIAAGGWKYVLLGFILFRIFDIVKPPPARQAEKWPHGWGIMADDWFAGVYAAIVLWIVRYVGWLG